MESVLFLEIFCFGVPASSIAVILPAESYNQESVKHWFLEESLLHWGLWGIGWRDTGARVGGGDLLEGAVLECFMCETLPLTVL